MKKLLTLITLATLTAPAHLGAMEAGEPETNPTSMKIEQTEQGVNGFSLLPLPVLETELLSYLTLLRDKVSLLIACMGPKTDRNPFKAILARIELNKNLLDTTMQPNLSKRHTAVKALLEKGARQTLTDHMKMSPLMHAAAHGSKQTVKFLLQHEAIVNQQDAHGQTALMKAVLQGHIPVIKLLKNAGAHVDVKSTGGCYAGLTALEAARAIAQTLKEGQNFRPINTKSSSNTGMNGVMIELESDPTETVMQQGKYKQIIALLEEAEQKQTQSNSKEEQ